MTALTTWLPSEDAAATVGLHYRTTIRKFASRTWHAHRSRPHSPAGQWWVLPEVVQAAAAGATLPEQKAACRWCQGRQVPPWPRVAGQARRRRSPTAA